MPPELKYFQVPLPLFSASMTQGGAAGLDLVTLPEDKRRGIDESSCEFNVPEKRSKKSFLVPQPFPNLLQVICDACR